MSDKWKSCDDVWKMYQLGQMSADHTDKQVFCEIYQQMTDRIKELESQVKRVESLPDQWLSLKPHNAISQIQYDAAITALRMCVEQLNKALEQSE